MDTVKLFYQILPISKENFCLLKGMANQVKYIFGIFYHFKV